MHLGLTDASASVSGAAAVVPAARDYAELLFERGARTLSLMDRERHSPTAGCCDRTYWAWKFTDFPGARFQESLCHLAFLYATPLPGSQYHRCQRLLDWIELGLRYWSRIQYRDGSFDEAYPFERSLAATAFSSFYIAEALGFLGDDLAAEAREGALETLARAGRWLAKNDETHGFLSNHLAAAAVALYHSYLLCDEPVFRQRSEYFRDRILRHQSDEGWYEEYGGVDPGYQTHGSFYLVRLWQLSGDDELRVSLCAAMRFLAHCVHVDGSIGGEYASRNTKTYYPAAFEMFRGEDPSAAWIAETMRLQVKRTASVGVRTVGQYNYFPLLNNVVFAFRAVQSSESVTVTAQEPSPEPGVCSFPEAGLVRIRSSALDTYVGTTKGGVVMVFDRAARKLLLRDCGYVGRLRGGQMVASQYLDEERPVDVGANQIRVEGVLCAVSKPMMSPVRFLGFRLFSLTAGRVPAFAHWLKRLLVKVLIYRRSQIGVDFARTIEIGEDFVEIKDQLRGRDAGRVESLRWEPTFVTVHMGSSRYFVDSELLDGDGLTLPAEELATGIELSRRVEVGGAAARTEV